MKEFLQELKENEIDVSLENENLKVRFNTPSLPPELVARLKAHKSELIAYLKNNQGNQEISIIPVSSDGYALSSSQYRLWVVSHFEEASIAYNMPAYIALEQQYEVDVLIQAIYQVVDRHEILRTIIKENEAGEARQWILDREALQFSIVCEDMREKEDASTIIDTFINKDIITPFNLSEGPLLRIKLFRLQDDAYALYVNMHHIISDDISKEILVSEIMEYYAALQENRTPNVSALGIQYKDFAAWQQQQKLTETYKADQAYWKEILSGTLPVLNFINGKTRPKLKTYHGRSIGKMLSEESTTQLKRFVEGNGSTLFVGLLSVWKLLFYRYTKQEDILVGIPTSGRIHKSLENQIGFYLNALALRTQVAPEATFQEFAATVKNNAFTAYKHQSYPFDDIVNDIEYNRDISRSPIFDILIDFHSTELYQTDVLNEQGISGQQYIKYDLEFHFVETPKNIIIHTSYNTDIYEENSIQQFLDHFEHFVKHLSTHIQTKIGTIDIVTTKEKQLLLEEFAGEKTTVEIPTDVMSAFQTQVNQTPTNTAVKFEDATLSYTELDELSNALANHLIAECNIQQNDVIAIHLDHNHWVSVALLGILKAGATFICIDPELPESRKEFIINSAAPVLLISEMNYMFDCDFFSETILAIDVEIDAFENKTKLTTASADTAYLIYTSGSTGTPKGVEIGQTAFINYLQWAKRYYGDDEAKNFGVFTTLAFDLTITSLFLPILTGGTVTFFDTKNPVATTLKRYFESDISYIKLTPAHILLLQDMNVQSDSLQHVIVGGDALETYHIQILQKINSQLTVYNEYGPTEATVGCIVDKVALNTNHISIGKPIDNTKVYILNDHKQLQPVNVAGELYIAGSGLALGYKNDSEQQKEKFIKNPFNADERVYKTGDIAKWTTEGTITYLGREDDQVKIRGYRVELGEIEKQLLEKPSVSAVKLIVVKKNDQKVIFGFVVSDIKENLEDLRSYLLQKLPEYMVPSRFFQLETLPLTRNGKIDKTALLDASDTQSIKTTTYLAPETEAEKIVAAIWQEELQYENVGVQDDFFSLGGDSILAIRVLSKINAQLKSNFGVADLFVHATIQKLLANISTAATKTPRISQAVLENFEKLVQEHPTAAHLEDMYPMSDIEIGMSYAYEMHKGEGVYHDQFVYPIFISNFDQAIFKNALDLMIQKHDVLRTSYDIQSFAKPMRLIHKEITPTLQFTDISEISRNEQEAHIESFMETDRENSFFDITIPGIWKMDIFKIDKDEHFLVFQFHHAILDGWSRASLITELNNTYFELLENTAYAPELLSDTYKEYVLEQETLKLNNSVHEFWKEQLADYKRLECFTQENEVENTSFFVEGDLYAQLVQFSEKHNITLRSISFALYGYTLQKLTYHTDILAGIVTSARPLTKDGDKIIGCFLNSVPVRLQSKNNSLVAFVKEIDNYLKEIKQYDKISLSELSNRYAEESEGNPFFDTIFNYVDFHVYEKAQFSSQEQQQQGLGIERFEQNNTYLDLIVSPIENGLFLEWNRFRTITSGLTNADLVDIYVQAVKDLVAVDAEEKARFSTLHDPKIAHKILNEFNNTESAYPETETVISLFEKQVQKSPSEIALVYKNTELTYEELNKKANQFAHFLRSKDVAYKDCIGVQLDRNDETIISLLGILKLGATYVPLDINYPAERVAFITSDCNCKLTVNESLLNEFSKEEYTDEAISLAVKPNDLIYIIFTSGSTGKPKGVMVTHQNVIASIHDMDKQLGYENATAVAISSNIVFDVSVLEIFATICYGKKAVVFDYETVSHPTKFIENLKKYEVEVLQLTPSRLKLLEKPLLQQEFSALQLLIIGGEAFPEHIFKQKETIGIPMVNVYGPTETTVWSTYSKLHESEHVHIGKPLYNYEVYIVNEFNQLQTIGVAGEICISGAGTTKGYLNQEERTKKSFIKHPFKPDTILYKTGDLGRRLPDGNLEFIGRIDNQVKLRGHRIELGEIEQVLRNHTTIEEVAVAIKTVNEEAVMVAYLVSEHDINTTEIRSYIAGKLPEYMIPSRFVTLDELPLNTNGKLDRKQLPNITAEDVQSTNYKEPTTETEKQLVQMWQELLGVNTVGIEDSFFELGGNSLQAMQLLGLIHQEFDVQVDLGKVFEKPTIAVIALEIDNVIWQKNYDHNKNTKKITI
ncbi:non-ribosomal peptide synthetase [uncultured Kordia sp.]|uniref:non-ribosomal peptide synthetase n=1 Tax=uncultured Kordia sp. TaxID=507699 RepID=UPI002627B899|nr:non-ribosomal peptide synthetase [uncultured Kordia sp.]